MGDRGGRSIEFQAARHILIPTIPCAKAAKRGPRLQSATSFLNSAAVEPQGPQRGQKPVGAAKNSKTETFRRCRIW
jgi:hypothetical protein